MRRSSMWIGLIAALGLAALASGPVRLFAQQIAGAGAQDVRPAIEKANIYIELMKMTERAADSWDRYASWVDMKTGPTGRERYISYGMYELHDVDGLMTEARAAAGKAPSTPKLDAAIRRYIDSYRALAPTMNHASRYYERRDYLADGVKQGKALHAKMVPLATAFLKERDATLGEVRAFLRDVERREAAAIEAREGRGRAWQVAQVMAAANRMIDVFPRERPTPIGEKDMEEMLKSIGPDTPGEKFDAIIAGQTTSGAATVDMKRYDQALTEFEQAVALFDGFAKEKPDGLDAFKDAPRALLERLRAVREPLARNGGRPPQDASGLFGQMVNIYFTMVSDSSSLSHSQLRFLP
jgi:hypothetical protein